MNASRSARHPNASHALSTRLSWLTAATLLGVAAWMLHEARPTISPRPLVLTPMVGGLDDCLQGKPSSTDTPLPAGCSGPDGSASALIEATLTHLGAPSSPAIELGYTLKAPLLDFLRPDGNGWSVDTAAIKRLANTLAQEKRPAVLYLFSNHFQTGAAIEKELAGQAENRAFSQKGPLPIDTYYGQPLYPWSIARTDNTLTQRRIQVIRALSNEICALPEDTRSRLIGITVLGETHQMFPHFESGMGFSSPYEISDYSPASIEGFRTFLRQRFGTLALLNQNIGSDFKDWSEVQPPSRDIRSRPLQGYWQHLDAYAHGVLPLSGWVAPEPGQPVGQGQVRVYLNGRLLNRAPIALDRQDVLAALPGLGSANVGWRSNLDFSGLPHGIYQLDFYLDRLGWPLRHLCRR